MKVTEGEGKMYSIGVCVLAGKKKSMWWVNIRDMAVSIPRSYMKYYTGGPYGVQLFKAHTTNPPPSTPFVPPSRSDWDLSFFQPLFDELLTPPPSVDYPAPELVAPIHEVVAPVPAVSTSLPSSTNVNQDAPSPSNSQTTPETQPPVIPNDVEEDNHDIEVAHMGNDP
ncbi:hypothetical protein Tco_0598646 [Tanacetum coccineum]